MADFDNLIRDVQGLLDGADLSERVKHFSTALGDMVVNRFKRHGEERVPKLYLSNLGKPLRQLYYDLKGYKGEPLSPETKFKFLYGDVIEELFMFLAKEAGHDVTDQQARVEVDGVSGKIDGFIDGVLVDVKSCSTRSFEKFKSGRLSEDDPFGYITQLSSYRKAVKAKRAAFIAIDKTLGDMTVYNLPDIDYDIEGRIAVVNAALSKDTPPERCYEPKKVSKTDKSGNLVLATGCSYCSHRFHCWADVNEGKGLLLRHYSSGPKFFVKIVKEPRLKEEAYESFPVKE